MSLLCALSGVWGSSLNTWLQGYHALKNCKYCSTGCKTAGVSNPKFCSRRRQMSRGVRICLAQSKLHLLSIHFLWIIWFDFGRTWSLVLAKALAVSAGVTYLVKDVCNISRQGQASLTSLGMFSGSSWSSRFRAMDIAANRPHFWFPEEAVQSFM